MSNEDRFEQIAAYRENEKIFLDAKKILDDLGLTVEDLLNKNKTLDLGASTAAVEKVVRLRGGKDNVVSFAKEVPNEVRNLGLNYVKGEAAELPFGPGAFDLIISHNGPLYLVEKQFEAEIILNEMLRVQSNNGESRIYPIRFGFIKRQLFDQNAEYFNIHAMAPADRSPHQIQRLEHFNGLANQKTLEYLSKLGFIFETEKSRDKQNSSKEFIIFHK